MIGDLIVWLRTELRKEFRDFIASFKKAWKEMFCIHDYETKAMKLLAGGSYKHCRKCGRIK